MKDHAIPSDGRLRRIYRSAVIGITGSMALSANGSPRIYATGVTLYDPAKAYPTDVIFAAPDNKTHLIDMDGHEVHRWEYVGFPSELLDPAVIGGERGHVLVQIEEMSGDNTSVVPGRPNLFRNKTIAELDWDGKVVWSWGAKAPGGAAKQHHDWYRLPNGNTLVLANLVHAIFSFTRAQVFDDAIYEVAPDGGVRWQWIASDHLEEFGFTPEALDLVRKHSQADYLHVNDMTALGPNQWFDAGDTRFNPDNILIDSREANFVAIIDKSSGKIVWRLGPKLPAISATNRDVPRPVDQFSGQHDAHLIPKGLPGAGHLLLFDNEGEAGYPPVALAVNSGSRVIEIDPVKQEIVWEYTGEDSDRPNWTFFSSFISSARRLPNGNTLIDEGMNGRIFQITPRGEIVWEYVNPYIGQSPVGGIKHSVQTNWVYRAQPVPYDWVSASPHAEVRLAPPAVTRYQVPGGP